MRIFTFTLNASPRRIPGNIWILQGVIQLFLKRLPVTAYTSVINSSTTVPIRYVYMGVGLWAIMLYKRTVPPLSATELL